MRISTVILFSIVVVLAGCNNQSSQNQKTVENMNTAVPKISDLLG